MFKLLKNLFKPSPIKISLIVDKNDEVLIVYKDKEIKKEPVSIEVGYSPNNLSSISNLFTTNQIEGGAKFTSFALISTERFKDNIVGHFFLGKYYISMSNNLFEFAYIFNTGSDVKIPATGIGVDDETFSFLMNLINSNKQIELDIDNGIDKISQHYIDPYSYEIVPDKKAGTKICGCQNKKRK